ncbi:MAG: glucuronate isomerase [Thermoguttaceae bacterium]
MNDIFITENFLLENDRAVELYHRVARDLPIIDYHCHLPPRQIAEDHRFANLTQIWLYGDHYKWRAMRSAGVAERYCTGDATDWEKFEKWAEVVPKTLRNPLYHWTHMELKRPFGISDRLLNPQTARGIWEQAGAMLARDDMSCRGIMRQMKVVLVCTTDDPVDSLEYHAAIAADPAFTIRVLPAFRPDRALAIDAPETFNHYVDRLAEVSHVDIGDAFPSFLDALRKRHDFFHQASCRLSDHGLETVDAVEGTALEATGIFARVRRGNRPSPEEIARFRSAMLYETALWDHERGWTQQFHLGAMRNNNTRMFRQVGTDAGFDSIADGSCARGLSRFLDRLDRTNQLAKTILYNLNPTHNEVLATMIGNFQDGSVPGKVQFGSGWWFLDQKDGIEKQINCLSNLGLLSCFVGMLTDSRSFLSYTRHEYFRRILCNLLGAEMHQGLLPDDVELVGRMVRDICYFNAERYFGFDLPR